MKQTGEEKACKQSDLRVHSNVLQQDVVKHRQTTQWRQSKFAPSRPCIVEELVRPWRHGARPALIFEASLLCFFFFWFPVTAAGNAGHSQNPTPDSNLSFGLPSSFLFLPYLATNKTKDEARRQRRKVRNHVQLDGYHSSLTLFEASPLDPFGSQPSLSSRSGALATKQPRTHAIGSDLLIFQLTIDESILVRNFVLRAVAQQDLLTTIYSLMGVSHLFHPRIPHIFMQSKGKGNLESLAYL